MGTIKIDGYEIGPDEAFPDLVHLTRRGDNSEALYVPLNVGAAAAIWEHMETITERYCGGGTMTMKTSRKAGVPVVDLGVPHPLPAIIQVTGPTRQVVCVYIPVGPASAEAIAQIVRDSRRVIVPSLDIVEDPRR